MLMLQYLHAKFMNRWKLYIECYVKHTLTPPPLFSRCIKRLSTWSCRTLPSFTWHSSSCDECLLTWSWRTWPTFIRSFIFQLQQMPLKMILLTWPPLIRPSIFPVTVSASQHDLTEPESLWPHLLSSNWNKRLSTWTWK